MIFIKPLKNKVKTLESKNASLMKKRERDKEIIELNDHTWTEKMKIKEKALDNLLEEKKNLTIENKIMHERMEFMKTMNEVKA